jgi:hypothetical protein
MRSARGGSFCGRAKDGASHCATSQEVVEVGGPQPALGQAAQRDHADHHPALLVEDRGRDLAVGLAGVGASDRDLAGEQRRLHRRVAGLVAEPDRRHHPGAAAGDHGQVLAVAELDPAGGGAGADGAQLEGGVGGLGDVAALDPAGDVAPHAERQLEPIEAAAEVAEVVVQRLLGRLGLGLLLGGELEPVEGAAHPTLVHHRHPRHQRRRQQGEEVGRAVAAGRQTGEVAVVDQVDADQHRGDRAQRPEQPARAVAGRQQDDRQPAGVEAEAGHPDVVGRREADRDHHQRRAGHRLERDHPFRGRHAAPPFLPDADRPDR